MKPQTVKHYEEVLAVSGIFAPIYLSSLLRKCTVRCANSNVTQAYQWSNEYTFLYHIIPILQGRGYHVLKRAKETTGRDNMTGQENTMGQENTRERDGARERAWARERTWARECLPK